MDEGRGGGEEWPLSLVLGSFGTHWGRVAVADCPSRRSHWRGEGASPGSPLSLPLLMISPTSAEKDRHQCWQTADAPPVNTD